MLPSLTRGMLTRDSHTTRLSVTTVQSTECSWVAYTAPIPMQRSMVQLFDSGCARKRNVCDLRLKANVV